MESYQKFFFKGHIYRAGGTESSRVKTKPGMVMAGPLPLSVLRGGKTEILSYQFVDGFNALINKVVGPAAGITNRCIV